MQNWHSNTLLAKELMVMDKFKEEQQVDNIICEGCGKRIPKLRLKALPDTQFCISCQEEYEHEHPADDSIYLTEADPSELSDIISPDD